MYCKVEILKKLDYWHSKYILKKDENIFHLSYNNNKLISFSTINNKTLKVKNHTIDEGSVGEYYVLFDGERIDPYDMAIFQEDNNHLICKCCNITDLHFEWKSLEPIYFKSLADGKEIKFITNKGLRIVKCSKNR